MHFTMKHTDQPKLTAAANRERRKEKQGPNTNRSASTDTSRKEQGHSVETKRKPQQTKHTHQWRLLKSLNPGEAEARSAGYHEVCESCQELR